MAMESSSFDGVGIDPLKCNKLSMEEKRELVYQISDWSHGACEMLQSWSRQEILQILCAEMGKERKYTGLTKLKIIEHLLKIVSEKKAGEHGPVPEPEPHFSSVQRTSKRQRKTDNPSQIPVPANCPPVNSVGADLGNTIYCKNSACKAMLNCDDTFCKRCSCCICYQYDDNKDPSLWLTCNSEPPFQGASCGMSCHLECALKHERFLIMKDGWHDGLDGSYSCVSCGKVNDLLGCWRKQLMIAKDTRRVDILCYRVSLSQKLLSGTEKYHKLYEIVDEAVKKLEAEVGPLTGLPVKMGRGIVNRLSSGQEVQKLCSLAVVSLDSMLSNSILNPSPKTLIQDIIRFEDVCATSLTVILSSEMGSAANSPSYILWHREAHEVEYPVKPTCTLLPPDTRFSISGLAPATDYYLKVIVCNGTSELGMCEVAFSTSSFRDELANCAGERSHSPATNCSSLSNPSSVEDESNNITSYSLQNGIQANSFLICKDTDNIFSANIDKDAIKPTGMGGGTSVDPVSLSHEEHAMGTVNPMPDSDAINLENKHSSGLQVVEEMSTDDGSNTPVRTGTECVPFVGTSEAGLPNTPCKPEIFKDGLGRNGRSKSSSKDLENGTGKGQEPQDGSTSKKRSGERRDDDCIANGLSDRDFEYYVKVVRWLECEGHIDKNFRQKFLTWYSLRASPEEVRVVKVFVDTFIDDPASLAGQLMDTFSDYISNKRSSVVPAGFCMKLWH